MEFLYTAKLRFLDQTCIHSRRYMSPYMAQNVDMWSSPLVRLDTPYANQYTYLEQTDNILYQKCGFPYKDLLIAVTDNCIHVLIFVPSIIAIIRNRLLKCTIDIITIHSVVPVMLK